LEGGINLIPFAYSSLIFVASEAAQMVSFPYSQSFSPHSISQWNTAHWCLQGSRLIWAPFSSSSCLRSCFYHTAQALFLSCSSSFCFTAQFLRHTTVLCLWSILLSIELAPFLEDERWRRKGSWRARSM